MLDALAIVELGVVCCSLPPVNEFLAMPASVKTFPMPLLLFDVSGEAVCNTRCMAAALRMSCMLCSGFC